MQRGRGRGELYDFGDPFSGFGGFGEHRSPLSSVFGKDPFDDLFFTHPIGSMFGPTMFGSSMFVNCGSSFGNLPNSGFLEHPKANKSEGLVIEELPSNDDNEDKDSKEKIDYPRKHSSASKALLVELPDEEIEERKSKHMQYRSEYNRGGILRPQTQTYSFQSSTVTYGGANGPYYSSSTTRRMGGDGEMVEENKEADTAGGRATHRISRGIHNKGHSITRMLNPDGKVDTVQMLHNLNEDELSGFEKTWKGSATKHLPGGWNQGFDNAGAFSRRGNSS